MGAPIENKNAEGNDGGRPTVYKPEFADQAYKLCLLGFTDVQLAKFFEVSERTIHNWKEEHVEFLQSVILGKDLADADVAQSFYKRAKGYEFEEVTFEKIDSKVNLEITPNDLIATDAYKKKIVTKHLPADAGAALNWLKNRQKDLWRDKQELSLDLEKLSDEDLDKLLERVTKKYSQ